MYLKELSKVNSTFQSTKTQKKKQSQEERKVKMAFMMSSSRAQQNPLKDQLKILLPTDARRKIPSSSEAFALLLTV